MKFKVLIILLILMLALEGCSKEEDMTAEKYKNQIVELNQEVIKYIDELEAKNTIITELEIALEENVEALEKVQDELNQLKMVKDNNDELEVSGIEPGSEGETKEIPQELDIEKGFNETDGLTTVLYDGGNIKLLDLEEDLNKKELGANTVLTEKISKGNGSVYYHKQVAAEGIKIDMYSDQDGDYVIYGIFIKSNEYVLKSGLNVGTTRDELDAYLKGESLEAEIYNDGVYENYHLNIGNGYSIDFEINSNRIGTIKLQYN